MDIFIHELIQGFIGQIPTIFGLVGEFKGVFASEGLKLIPLSFHEFTLTSCLVAAGWIAIFWKNKGLLLSGLSHVLHLTERLIDMLEKA